MNQYTQLLEYIRQLADADITVSTVTNSEPDKIDWNRANLFPLVNVSVTGGSFTNCSTVKFTVELACLNVRETNKEIDVDKFWGNDNEVDNMNTTLAVLNRIWNIAYKDFNDNNIKADENPSLAPLFEERTNLLDGWLLTFDVELPNTTINLCQ